MTKASLITAVVLLLAATISWGGTFAVAKPVLAEIDVFYMTLFRYAPASIAFLLIAMAIEGPESLRLEGRFLALLALSTVGFVGFNVFLFTGIAHSRPEHGAVVMATMPMIAALLSWQLKGLRPASFTMATIFVAFFGVFLVITGGHPIAAFSGGAANWDLLFIAGAVCWVSYTMGAQLVPHWSPLRYSAITCALGSLAAGMITLALTLSGILEPPTLDAVISFKWNLAFLIVPGALIAVISWNVGIKILGAINGVLFVNFIPITAYLIGVAQGTPLGWLEVTGAGLVIGSLIANNLYVRRLNNPVKLPTSTGAA